MEMPDRAVGFQEEEESSDKAPAAPASAPVPLHDASAGKTQEDVSLEAQSTQGDEVVHTGSPPKLRAIAALHASQAASHLDHEPHHRNRLVDGDLGEHPGLPSTEEVDSVATQAIKANMRKLGSSAQLNRDEQYYQELEDASMVES